MRLRVAVLLALAAGSLLGAAPAGAGESERAMVRGPIPWSFLQAGPQARSLEIEFAYGGCEQDPVATVRQEAASLKIEVSTERPGPGSMIACPQIARLVTRRVPLSAPIAGRSLAGSWVVGSRPPLAPAHVPRVLGLSPGDARRVMAGEPGMHLHALVRFRHGLNGLARVLAQEPGAGAGRPSGGTVRLVVGER